jgi:hypothetical protein
VILEESIQTLRDIDIKKEKKRKKKYQICQAAQLCRLS